MTSPSASAGKAQLGMTTVLGAAVILGGALAFVNSRAARNTTARPELAALTAAAAPAAAPEPAVASEDDSAALSGAVLETVPASKYTYLRLSTAAGEVWAAVPSATVSLGTRVTIVNAARMADFKSATLKRTFKEIYFGTLAGPLPAAAPASEHKFSPADVLGEDEQTLPAGHPKIGSGAAPGPVSADPELPNVTILAATGKNAHVIAELTGQRLKLAGQRVRVRGQVTRVTPNVQGHTFFHLRDGNPANAGAVSDLVVTSSIEPQRGQVAIFEGTLRADVDVGIGYRYPVLLENATLVSVGE